MTIKSRLAAAEQAAERIAATRQARLARRPITTVEELVVLLTAANDEGTSEAFFETFWDRTTPEVAAAFREAIRLELAERAAQRVRGQPGGPSCPAPDHERGRIEHELIDRGEAPPAGGEGPSNDVADLKLHASSGARGAQLRPH